MVSTENDTHYCFTVISDPEKAKLFRQIYDNQYSNTNCSKVYTKKMWSSGWGADLSNVIDGLQYALDTRAPMQVYHKGHGWHYAAMKDGSKPVCQTRDMYCYFLNLTKCPAQPGKNDKNLHHGYDGHGARLMKEKQGYWLLEYATRMRAWLRREVYLYSTSKINLTLPCAAIHVRRSDIVLHDKFSRRYRKMEEYVEALPDKNGTKNLLLFTDDMNAIGEALYKYPQYNWMYFDRPRFKGASGGWENQIPSADPKLEVVVLLSIFRLVRQCHTLIRSRGNLANLMWSEMEFGNTESDVELRHIDLDKIGSGEVFSPDHSYSANVSIDYSAVQATEARTEQDKAAALTFPEEHESSSSQIFCVPWGVENERVDAWWTHHPEWGVSIENNTHYCFSPISDPAKAKLFRQIYDNQYTNTNCTKVHTKKMWSSGWGADFSVIIDGLQYAMNIQRPLQMYNKRQDIGWHYAAMKDGTKPVCETRDMYCYFLNLTKCPPKPGKKGKRLADGYDLDDGASYTTTRRGYWLLEYATRMQAWLRREVYLYSTTKINLTLPCAAIHVRRSDIVLHETESRRYRKIEEYVEALPDKNNTHNLFLMTDDTNAIGEALHKYPQYNWMYIDRPRFKGTSGGWENQIPSSDPKYEVVVLLSIFRLVRQCHTLIRTYGNFADLLRSEMLFGNSDKDAGKLQHIDLDEGDPNSHRPQNMYTVNVSIDYVNQCKAEQDDCVNRFDCCNGLGCFDSKCKKCKGLKQECTVDDECCETFSCYDGKCEVT